MDVAAEATDEQVELEEASSVAAAEAAGSEPPGTQPPRPLPLSAARSSSPPATDSAEARQILALISEIGSNQMLKEDFHPWFWGPNPAKLMTV